MAKDYLLRVVVAEILFIWAMVLAVWVAEHSPGAALVTAIASYAAMTAYINKQVSDCEVAYRECRYECR